MDDWQIYLLRRRQYLADQLKYAAEHPDSRLEEITNGVRTDVTEDFRDKLEEEYAFVCGILEGAGKAPGSENLS